MRIIKAILFLLFLSLQVNAQEQSKVVKLFNEVFNDTVIVAKPKFLAYPVIGYSPETRWEFGASAFYVYNAKNNLDNRLSELYAFAFITLENQYGLWLDHAAYTDKNKYYFLGKFRMQQFPLLYHGIGVNAPYKPVARIDGLNLSLRERLSKEVRKNLYLGLELDFSHLSSVEVLEQTVDFVKPKGIDGFTNFGIGLGLLFDQRYNVLNPRKGIFLEAGFLSYNQNFGSEFAFNNYFFDFRYYQPTFKNQILAYHFLMNAVVPNGESDLPFSQLALMGGESIMRGYYMGRYRDNLLLATQAEYRFLPFPFSKRLGGTVFAGFGAVSPNAVDLGLDKVKVAAGTGLRFLIFPGKDIFTRFDVAVTSEGVGYYFYVGEAF